MKLWIALLLLWTPLASAAWQHFEARQVHPLAMTPDGTRLVAADSPSARVTVFDLSSGTPVRLGHIPVGLEPVTVRARTNDEIWVVNEVSDSISILSLSSQAVVDTLRTGDEPSDVVFAAGKAYVSCARDAQVRVYDPTTRVQIGLISLHGVYPHALAANADGTRLYAAFLLSGNRTTVLPKEVAPPQPAPTNPALPAPPDTALIVPASDPRVTNTILDHDVAEVDTSTDTVLRMISDVGTNLFDVACRPGENEVWVSNTEALNLIQFEPALRGHFADNRLTVIDAEGVHPHDLNPGIDYSILPNPTARATALAQPTSLAFTADGTALWVAAFASDRIAKVDPETAAVLSRVDVRTGTDTSAARMRGPRGLVLDETRQRLYVLNKLSSSLSVIRTDTAAVVDEVPLAAYDPMPRLIREGRGQLFDARLSGNGTASCGTCHLDADRDGMAWDLGDPGGEMMTVFGQNLSVHDSTLRPYSLHPMKGPMVTQTLRGMQEGAPFHWRGDRPTLQSFNSTFDLLMGGEELNKTDMDNLADYLKSIVHHANPNRNLDRTLRATLSDGSSPQEGVALFNSHVKSHCITCHTHPLGSNNNIDLPQESGLSQPVKNPPLRTIYQRLTYDGRAGAQSLSGFGMLHDGVGFQLPIVHPYVLDLLETPQEFADVSAFMRSFDTGTAPIVGYSRVVTSANRTDPTVLADLALLESETTEDLAKNRDSDLIVRGKVGGEFRSLRWVRGTQTGYRWDQSTQGIVTRAVLLSSLNPGDWLTFMGVLPGTGERFGGDEDEDGFLDRSDPNPGLVNGKAIIRRQPVGATVLPGAEVVLSVVADGIGLTYQWRRGTTLVGTNSPQLRLFPIASQDAGSYTVVITTSQGSVTSQAAAVAVTPAPEITRHPAPVTVKQGANASFSVSATGTGLRYEWRRNDQPIPGATRSSHTVMGASPLTEGTYTVRVYNSTSSVTSNPAPLTVLPWPVMNPLNLPQPMVGQDYRAQVSASHSPIRFSATDLPPGLTLNATTGVISGRPTTARAAPGYPVRVRATNANGTGFPWLQNVVVSPFPADALGTFQGVVPRHESSEVNGNLGGRLTLTTTSLGAFSGTLTLGTASHAFSGKLSVQPDADPTGTVTLPRRSPLAALTLRFTLQRATRSLSGQLETTLPNPASPSERLTVQLPLAAYLPEALPAGLAGHYTFASVLSDEDRAKPELPQGHSVGAFRVSTAGAFSGVLWLADGSSPITLSGPLRQGGRLPLFQLLYSNTGSVLGTVQIDSSANFSLASTSLSWFKRTQASNSTTRSYKGGIAATALETFGRRYVIPANTSRAMGLPAGTGNARLLFREGGAPTPETRLDLLAFEIQGGSPARIPAISPNPGAVKITVTPGSGTSFTPGVTGVFRGHFLLVDRDTSGTTPRDVTRTTTFSGMIVDDGRGPRGYGFFNLAEMPTAGPPRTTPTTTRQLSGRVELSGQP